MRLRATSQSCRQHHLAPNTLDRQFYVSAMGPVNCVWAADITYFSTRSTTEPVHLLAGAEKGALHAGATRDPRPHLAEVKRPTAGAARVHGGRGRGRPSHRRRGYRRGVHARLARVYAGDATRRAVAPDRRPSLRDDPRRRWPRWRARSPALSRGAPCARYGHRAEAAAG